MQEAYNMKLNHLGTKELSTKRLILRKLNFSDANSVFYNWANDPEVTRYLTWNYHKSVEESKFILGLWIDGYKTDRFYQWGIELKDTNELIGSISTVNIGENILTCEIGYCIGRKWWGNGYVLEALKEVMRFMFEEVGVNRIEATHQTENVNSGKVMIKSGMKYEGRFRERALDNQGNLVDIDIYSILRREYK